MPCSAWRPTLKFLSFRQTTANASITPPTGGRPWEKYNLTYCLAPISGPLGSCITKWVPHNGAPTLYQITGLTTNTRYRAWATAVKGTVASLQSLPASIQTIS